MSEGIQLLLLLLAWVVLAIGCHVAVRRYYLASFIAACAMIIAMQIAAYYQIGRIDPAWPVTTLVGFFMAGIVALLVGLPFRVIRQLRDTADMEAAGPDTHKGSRKSRDPGD